MKDQQPQHVLAVQNELGEGPLWDPDGAMLLWLDIRGNQLHTYGPGTNYHQSIALASQVTALGLFRERHLIAATAQGIAFWQHETGLSKAIVHPLQDIPNVRFNDGAVDPAGRFWVGTMSTVGDNRPVHALYRLDRDVVPHQILDDVILSNGLGWSPDYRTMYFVDSLRQNIYSFDFDLASGDIANRQVFARIPEKEGVPDGMAVDAEGCVWSAIWGGWKVVRFDPTGRRMLELNLPVAHVTSCAFAGHNLSTLYITTAWTGLSETDRQAQPLAGDLFCVETDTKGQPPTFFASHTKS